eukprot:PhF_6_TR21972/c0_g1_i1/m.31249
MLRRSSHEHLVDYDAEAVALWQRLGIDPTTSARGYNPMDPIYKHPTTGATIYVGNQSAAQNLTKLKEKNITHVVNCTHGWGALPNYHIRDLKYYGFSISGWNQHVDSTSQSILRFALPMFEFIEKALANGESVLVHCLAGAHRAGTTGCACLIYFGGLDSATAIRCAKSLRPIIDPISNFPEFLVRLETALNSVKRKAGEI